MGPRSAVLVVALVVALTLTSACSSPVVPAERVSAGAPSATAPPPSAPLPTTAPATSPATVPTVGAVPPVDPASPLPAPIPIPPNSYAPEDVVEIGIMEIPAIGLKHRIFQGVTLNNIDRGPSHWTGSAMPGQVGNTVFAGHRATNSQPFRRIDALVPGDKVIFTVRGVRSTYRVTGELVVDPEDSWIAEQTHAYTGTLYACHPVGSMAQRYVVRMELEGV